MPLTEDLEFPLIKLAKKLKAALLFVKVKATQAQHLFPLIKLAKKLKEIKIIADITRQLGDLKAEGFH